MVQVHISHLSREIKDHNFLYRDASEETLKLLAYFRDQITVPLVLECVAQTQEEINGITEEINFLKKF